MTEAPVDISASSEPAAKASDDKSAQPNVLAEEGVPTSDTRTPVGAGAAPPTAPPSSEAAAAAETNADQPGTNGGAGADTTGSVSACVNMNPAMRRMLERQKAAKQKQKKAGGGGAGGGFGSFLFGGGGGGGGGSRRPSKKERQEGAAAAAADDGDSSNTTTHDPKAEPISSSSSPADIHQSSSKEDDNNDGEDGEDTDASSTYEHGLRPGDHVYRWSHFGYTYPIQIHGIVLDASSSSSSEEEEGEGKEGNEKDDGEGEGAGDANEEANADANESTTDNGAKNDDSKEEEEAASLSLPAPKCQKIVWVTIADFGFTRKGDDDTDADGDGTATAPASLHSSDLEGQKEDDTDIRSGADADAKTTDEIQPKDSEDTTATSTSTSTNGEEPTGVKSTGNRKPPRPKSLKKSDESFLAQHLKKGKRLNVITLTDPKDIKKWRKVNYGGKGLFGGGDGGDGDEDAKDDKTNEVTGEKKDAEDDENIEKNTTAKKDAGGNRFTSWLRSNPSSRCTSPTTTEADAEAGNDSAAGGEPISIQATPSTDFGELDAKEISEHGDHQSAPSPSESNNKATQEASPSSSEEISDHPPTSPTDPEKAEAEPQTLEEMVAAANAVDLKARQSPRRRAPEDATEAESSGKQDEADKTVRKSSSLANIWPFKKTGDAKDTSEETGDGDKSNKQSDPSTVSKSDPAKIVLARVRFLLENEDDVLPAYHVFNSNSECIAVWCKTGRWSSLQSDVFWHTTAIGNAKSTTLMGLSLAATQPWLIPALPVAAVAAIGTPYLVLHQSKKKCEEATRQLTEGFWAQAGPEVYVEAIKTWSGIPA